MRPGARAGVTRRDALGAAAALGAACATGATRAAAEPAATGLKLRLGISTLGFDQLTHAQLAKELAGERIRLVQLFLAQSDTRYWKYNGTSDVSSMTPVEARRAPSGDQATVGLNLVSALARVFSSSPVREFHILTAFSEPVTILDPSGDQASARTLEVSWSNPSALVWLAMS